MTKKINFKEEYTENRFDNAFEDVAVFFSIDELVLAKECSNRTCGQIYTEVEAEGKFYYIKGVHFVNRVNYVVIPLGWKEHMLDTTLIGAVFKSENLNLDERYYADFGKSKRIVIKKFSNKDGEAIDIMLCEQKTGKEVKVKNDND